MGERFKPHKFTREDHRTIERWATVCRIIFTPVVFVIMVPVGIYKWTWGMIEETFPIK